MVQQFNPTTPIAANCECHGNCTCRLRDNGNCDCAQGECTCMVNCRANGGDCKCDSSCQCRRLEGGDCACTPDECECKKAG